MSWMEPGGAGRPRRAEEAAATGRTSGAAAAYEAAVPGTCGELVQGAVAGVDFLVSCPVDRYAVARFHPGADPPEAWLRHLDASPKVQAALRHLAERTGVPLPPGRLALHTALPRGRGYGSSTAEVVAAVAAVAAAAGTALAPRELAGLALAVEPSDSVMFPGLALLDHRRGRVHGPLGPAPVLEVLIHDPGGEVDTLAFNRRGDLAALNAAKEPLVREALALVADGVASGDAEAVGAGATLSALAHQPIMPKPHLERVLALAREAGALGVCVAHSGTVTGILCDPRRTPAAEAAPFLARRLGTPLEAARLVAGGVRLRQCAPAEEGG